MLLFKVAMLVSSLRAAFEIFWQQFDKDLDVLCIYCMIPKIMHLDVERVHERYNKP